MMKFDGQSTRFFFAIFAFVVFSACLTLFVKNRVASDFFDELHQETTNDNSPAPKQVGENKIQWNLSPGPRTLGSFILGLYEGFISDSLPAARSAPPLFEPLNLQTSLIQYPGNIDSHNKLFPVRVPPTIKSKLSFGLTKDFSILNGSPFSVPSSDNRQQSLQQGYWKTSPISLVSELSEWTIYLISFFWMLVLPGWAFATTIIPNWSEKHWAIKVSIAGGIMVALYPLLFLWGDLIGIKFTPGISWIVPIGGVVIITIKNLLNFNHSNILAGTNHFEFTKENILNSIKIPQGFVPDIIIFFVLILIFFSRFYAIRNLVAPMWGDSYQHAVISQLIVENNGMFSSWEPYAPYMSLTIQYGFSVIVTLISWLTDINVVKATLITGQMLNFFAVFTLVALASKLNPKNRWISIGVLIIAGLLSSMPAYYVNWGRYAQLSGLVILPIALWFFWDIYDLSGIGWNYYRQYSSYFVLSGAVISGMLLTYYRMAFYFAAFCVAFISLTTIIEKPNYRDFFSRLGRLLVLTMVAFILFLPWISRISGSSLAGAIGYGITANNSFGPVLDDLRIWLDVQNYISIIFVMLAVFALIWAIYVRKIIAFIFPLWYLLLVIYIGSQLVNIPGANMMQSFTIIISLYLPVCILIGWLFGDIIARKFQIRNVKRTVIFSSILIIILSIGFWKQAGLSNPKDHALVYPADLKAMQWIEKNIPKDSLFLIEGYSIYNGSSIVGSDAGWWIPLFAARQNTIPPQYALLNEEPDPPEYSQQVIHLINTLEQNSLNSADSVKELCNLGISHVYIGQAQGTVGTSAKQLYSEDDLSDHKFFKLLYSQNRVRIYSFQRTSCEFNT